MAIDTVRLKSPFISASLAQRIERKCILRQGVSLESGTVLYEITTGDLAGSWDSRISLKVMRQDFGINKNGRPELCPSPPYLLLECSAHKAILGHNVYGGPTGFEATCATVVALVEQLLGVELPPVTRWTVRRVDWAEMYRLPFAAIQEFFEGIATAHFPRRQGSKHGSHAVHFPGSTTTVKLYHKGPEFAAHDRARMKRFLHQYRTQAHPGTTHTENLRWVTRKVEALQRLANNRLRVEVDIHAEKLDFDFGHKPLVPEITDDYLRSVHDREVRKLLKEGQPGIEVVREKRTVSRRLTDFYGDNLGNILFAFWVRMGELGETFCRETMPRATFYRRRRQLIDAGISWLNACAPTLPNQTALPIDFTPLRTDPRICLGSVRSKPAFAVDRGSMFKNERKDDDGTDDGAIRRPVGNDRREDGGNSQGRHASIHQ